MRRVLTDELNYLSNEVDMIEPQIAAVVIERGLSRPAAGMPTSWKKTNIAKSSAIRDGGNGGPGANVVNLITKTVQNVFGGASKSVGFILRATKVALPVALGLVLIIKSGSLEKLKNFDIQSLKGSYVPKRSTLQTIKSQKTTKADKTRKTVRTPLSVKEPAKRSQPKSNGPRINLNSLETMRGSTWLDKIR